MKMIKTTPGATIGCDCHLKHHHLAETDYRKLNAEGGGLVKGTGKVSNQTEFFCISFES
jgi:hypothetical protein